ncbi:MAG: Ldh family oxidoreductase [Alphaproteobacteria bacterium]|nr:Ldh family oxidoreductase [Alphaproteobacteria bacterium]
MSDGDIIVTAEALKDFAARVFTACDVAPDDAALWADLLVWANLRGVDSHGVLRIPRYIQTLGSGDIHARPNITVDRRDGAIAVIDCDAAPGPVGMSRAMEEAIERAREVHIGWCVARNITHCGAIGYYAQIAAKAGMAGMVMIASRPMMAYHGASVAALSTNPLAIAVPGGAHPPLVLDMSTSTVSMGKVLEARDAGQPIPDNWGMDAAGRMTNDPNQVAMLMPLGGAKGSSLSLMLECLVSLMGANPLIEPLIRPGADPSGFRQNGLAVAIDIQAFVGLDDYGKQVDDLAEAITALPRADGVDEIYAPGERGDAVLAERMKNGIPLPQGTWERLAKAVQPLGVEMPEVG